MQIRRFVRVFAKCVCRKINVLTLWLSSCPLWSFSPFRNFSHWWGLTGRKYLVWPRKKHLSYFQFWECVRCFQGSILSECIHISLCIQGFPSSLKILEPIDYTWSELATNGSFGKAKFCVHMLGQVLSSWWHFRRGLMCAGKLSGSHISCYPYEKWREHHENTPI